jgi:hypothetical protein
MHRCPHPDCSYIASWVSNAHCVVEHGVSKEELLKQYGKKRCADLIPIVKHRSEDLQVTASRSKPGRGNKRYYKKAYI